MRLDARSNPRFCRVYMYMNCPTEKQGLCFEIFIFRKLMWIDYVILSQHTHWFEISLLFMLAIYKTTISTTAVTTTRTPCEVAFAITVTLVLHNISIFLSISFQQNHVYATLFNIDCYTNNPWYHYYYHQQQSSSIVRTKKTATA